MSRDTGAKPFTAAELVTFGQALQTLSDRMHATKGTRELACAATKLDEARLWVAEYLAEHADEVLESFLAGAPQSPNKEPVS